MRFSLFYQKKEKKEKAFAVPTAAQINAQRNFLCVFFEKNQSRCALWLISKPVHGMAAP
jgi:hypothetical protein